MSTKAPVPRPPIEDFFNRGDRRLFRQLHIEYDGEIYEISDHPVDFTKLNFGEACIDMLVDYSWRFHKSDPLKVREITNYLVAFIKEYRKAGFAIIPSHVENIIITLVKAGWRDFKRRDTSLTLFEFITEYFYQAEAKPLLAYLMDRGSNPFNSAAIALALKSGKLGLLEMFFIAKAPSSLETTDRVIHDNSCMYGDLRKIGLGEVCYLLTLCDKVRVPHPKFTAPLKPWLKKHTDNSYSLCGYKGETTLAGASIPHAL